MTTEISGTIVGKREPRLVRVDGLDIEAVPEGYMVIVHNNDAPGVIGPRDAAGVVLGHGLEVPPIEGLVTGTVGLDIPGRHGAPLPSSHVIAFGPGRFQLECHHLLLRSRGTVRWKRRRAHPEAARSLRLRPPS